jgi:Ca-activated chloride channel family protein
MDSFAFERPLWLYAILLVLLCAWKCRAKESALIFPGVSILKRAASKKSFLPEFLKYTALIGVIVALAGPVRVDRSVEIKKKGYDIVLALDASGSMRESGFDPADPTLSKFDVVKELVKEFVRRRKNDNIALVVFGSYAYVASPLTFNKKVIAQLLDYLEIGIAGQKTALNDALFESVHLLSRSEAKSKIVILLTDGLDTASRTPPDVVVKMAKKYGVRIYTIGIGERRGIDEEYLRWIAEHTGGRYFFAPDAGVLREVYAAIDRLEPSEIRGEEFVKKEQLYQYPLFAATLALLGFIYIYSKRGF